MFVLLKVLPCTVRPHDPMRSPETEVKICEKHRKTVLFAKIYSDMKREGRFSFGEWLDEVQAVGQFSFSKETLHRALPTHSETAIKRLLHRKSESGKIVSIHKGYYVIIPPQFSSKGIIPPHLYVDSLMKYLNRPYYVGLLSAASYHGASHQKPQEFFIFTNLPPIRTTERGDHKINYISKSEINYNLIDSLKTEAGYIKVSNPLLTAYDLIHFEKRIGGINRAASVINELSEHINIPINFDSLISSFNHSTLQRLGYLLEFACSNIELSNRIYDALLMNQTTLFRTPLKSSENSSGFPSDNRWKVIENTDIEIDE